MIATLPPPPANGTTLNGSYVFSRMIDDWYLKQGWTYRKLHAVSALASGGKAKFTANYLGRIRKEAENPNSIWKPQPAIFQGLEELFRFLHGYNNGTIKPSLPFRSGNEVVTEADLVGKQALLDESGNVLTVSDLYAIYLGTRQLPDYCHMDPVVTEQVAANFGFALERALIESGLSPIRAAGQVLEHYIGDKDKLRQVLFAEAEFTPQELDDNLHNIAYALSKAAGRQWSPRQLAALALSGSASLST